MYLQCAVNRCILQFLCVPTFGGPFVLKPTHSREYLKSPEIQPYAAFFLIRYYQTLMKGTILKIPYSYKHIFAPWRNSCYPAPHPPCGTLPPALLRLQGGGGARLIFQEFFCFHLIQDEGTSDRLVFQQLFQSLSKVGDEWRDLTDRRWAFILRSPAGFRG